MYFQKVVKGIAGLNRIEAEQMVKTDGITCNWWRKVGTITPAAIQAQLTEKAILCHLNQYDDPLPSTHALAKPPYSAKTYGNVTPFISTTAGAIQRDKFRQRNIIFPPFLTALRFATNNFRTSGFIFYAYLCTLGKQAISFEGLAEEVRELHIYQQYLPFHHEGEITAKIIIPSAQIEKAIEYDGRSALQDLRKKQIPSPIGTPILNPAYAKPEAYANIRELL
jgi:hypothetical protein